MFPCLCAQGSSIAEYLDFSRIAVKRDTCVLVCLYALRGFTRPSYISGGGVEVCFSHEKQTLGGGVCFSYEKHTLGEGGEVCFSYGKQTLRGGVCFSYEKQTLGRGVCFSYEKQTLGGGICFSYRKQTLRGGRGGRTGSLFLLRKTKSGGRNFFPLRKTNSGEAYG